MKRRAPPPIRLPSLFSAKACFDSHCSERPASSIFLPLSRTPTRSVHSAVRDYRFSSPKKRGKNKQRVPAELSRDIGTSGAFIVYDRMRVQRSMLRNGFSRGRVRLMGIALAMAPGKRASGPVFALFRGHRSSREELRYMTMFGTFRLYAGRIFRRGIITTKE